MKLFELIENLEAFKRHGDCDVFAADGAVSFAQDGVTTRIVCDEETSPYAIGNCDIKGMDFGEAIKAMKRGKRVCRKGWNGKGMWLCIPLVDGPKEIPATGIWGKPNADYAEKNGGTVKVMPYITMKAADGSIVMGWLASQTDMLAEDWTIVE